MEKWRKIVITILLFPFLLGIGLFIGLLFWLSLGISLVIPAIIIIWLFAQERALPPTTPANTPVIPEVPTPATPSGGWNKVITAIVILALIGAGYLMYTNWAYIEGVLPKSAPEPPKLSFGCGESEESSSGTWVNIIGITEGGFDSSQCFSSPLLAEGRSLSLTVTGNTTFRDNDGSSSEADADGASILAGKRGRPTGDKIPLGAVVFTVDSKTLHLLGKEKYFQVKSGKLEVYNKKGGTLLESLPVGTQSLKFNVNCAGKNADGTPICKAGYEIRLEYSK